MAGVSQTRRTQRQAWTPRPPVQPPWMPLARTRGRRPASMAWSAASPTTLQMPACQGAASERARRPTRWPSGPPGLPCLGPSSHRPGTFRPGYWVFRRYRGRAARPRNGVNSSRCPVGGAKGRTAQRDEQETDRKGGGVSTGRPLGRKEVWALESDGDGGSFPSPEPYGMHDVEKNRKRWKKQRQPSAFSPAKRARLSRLFHWSPGQLCLARSRPMYSSSGPMGPGPTALTTFTVS